MKNLSVITLLLVSISIYAGIYESSAFKMPYKDNIDLFMLRNMSSISKDTTLIFDVDTKILGMAISGKTILKNNDALVRVLLISRDGKEYLVFEDTYMFPNETEHEFLDVAMESVILENVVPYKLSIFIQNAELSISQIKWTLSNEKCSLVELMEERKTMLKKQEEYLIDRWNQTNIQSEKYWLAGKTCISGLSYSEKKKALGATNNHYLSDGIEYYIGGFFVMKDHGDICSPENKNDNNITAIPQKSTPYVENFDWRNRHGKNWMTSVKNQIVPNNSVSGNGGCWAFGSLAALESHLNLYYNRLLNLDLSEQELGSCSAGSLASGGNALQAYNYIKSNKISNEECFPFQNNETIPCDNKCTNPEYTASISDYVFMTTATDQLKSELIQHGPIASGYNNGYTNHLMCLCGYGTITAGTHIEFAPQTSAPNIDTVIPENSNLIGKTYWIYKNSFGDENPSNGYLYVVYENDNIRNFSYRLPYPVTVSTLTTNDIVCEDSDNDGYYFWGLGPKPENCPICCPDVPDGDDSNPQLTEMDSYGNFSSYTFPYPTTQISSDIIWNTNQLICGNIIITNNASLIISAQLTMNPAAKIIVKDGGTLVVDAGSIVNANIEVQDTGKLRLLNNGVLYLKQFGKINVHIGAEANMEYGQVILQ